MLDDLHPKHGATRARKRVGRGPGSGKGKTSGTGVKGQGTRSGTGPSRARHEGGQMRLQMRLPKKGFNNTRFRTVNQIVNLADLARVPEGTEVDAAALERAGLIRGNGSPIKVLGKGDAPKGLKLR